MVYILFTLLFKFHDGRILVGWNFPKYIYIYTRPTLFRGREEKKKEKETSNMFETLFRVQSLGEAGKSWNNVNFLLVANRKKGRKGGREGKTLWALLFRIIYQADERARSSQVWFNKWKIFAKFRISPVKLFQNWIIPVRVSFEMKHGSLCRFISHAIVAHCVNCAPRLELNAKNRPDNIIAPLAATQFQPIFRAPEESSRPRKTRKESSIKWKKWFLPYFFFFFFLISELISIEFSIKQLLIHAKWIYASWEFSFFL